jgi:hypothetical protein
MKLSVQILLMVLSILIFGCLKKEWNPLQLSV